MSSAIGKKCLITGATGFLGRHAVAALQAQGYLTTLLSRKNLDVPHAMCADLRDEHLDLGETFFSQVFHLAGLAHLSVLPDKAAADFFAINVQGTKNLLRALERLPKLPDSLVFASSVAVYGRESGELLDETTSAAASDPYGASKREAEEVIQLWGKQHGVAITILRLPLLVGLDAPGNFGAMVGAMRSRWYFSIGDGSARRSMVLAEDVAHFLPRLAGLTTDCTYFHLTDGHHPQFCELESALALALNVSPPRKLSLSVAHTAAMVGDGAEKFCGIKLPFNSKILRKITSTLTFSDVKARRVLDWKPSRVVDYLESFHHKEIIPGRVVK